MKLTTRRIVLVLLVLVLFVLIFLMFTDRPASAEENLPKDLISQAGGVGMLATICSVGGFFVGGGAVYIYAKATNQKIEWRGVPGVRFVYLHCFQAAERRHAS